MRKCSIVCLLFFLFTVLLFGQDNPPAKTLSVNSVGLKYFEKAQQFMAINQDSSIYYLALAIPLFEENENWNQLVDSYYNLTWRYYNKRDIENFEYYSGKGMTLAEKYLEEHNPNYLNAMGSIGTKWEIKGNFPKAISIYKSLAEKSKKIEDVTNHAKALNNLSHNYFVIGKVDKAILHIEQAIQLLEEGYGKDHIDLLLPYYHKADFLIYIGKKEQALDYLKKGKKILLSNNLWDKNNYSTLIYLAKFAKIFSDLDQNNNAKKYLNKALLLAKDSIQMTHAFRIYGELSFKEKEYDQAKTYYEAAGAQINKQYRQFIKHPVKAGIFKNLAELYEVQNDYSKALAYYQKGLVQLSTNFNDLLILNNPKIADISKTFDGKLFLERKTNTLYKFYQQNGNLDYLRMALSTAQLANQTTRYLRQDHWAKGSVKFNAKDDYAHYEKSIIIAFELFEQTGEKKYQDAVFEIVESNKSNILLESLQDNLAKGLGELPDSLLLNEVQMTLDINFYEKQLSEEASKIQKNKEKITQYKEQLFLLKNQYEQLIKNLEQNYPKYYQLKYDFSTPTLTKVQKSLEAKEQILEYFKGEENLIIFSITREKVTIQKYPITEHLNSTISELLELVRNGPTLQNQLADFSSFIETAHQLYQQLIAPIIDINTNKLIIIPDGELNYLPFELLLTSVEAEEEILYANLPYLLKKVGINYQYSSNLYERTKRLKQSQTAQPFVGFAPSFGEIMIAQTRNCTNNELYSLNCSQKELAGIAALIDDSQSIIGINATKDNFIKEAANGRILHLATHACINEENPMLSKIYFSDDYLTYYDLNNLILDADLAVLSACNTGNGKLEKGEGIMSLAKGFIQVGVQSVVVSLWSIDDCATSDIMTQFYKHLNEGEGKDEALRNAKLAYLQIADKVHAHPFYWGAFVQFGNTNSLGYLPVKKKMARFLLIGLVGILFYILSRKVRFDR